MNAIWHDLECGAYVEDLETWRALAAERRDGPVLDVGAGTGRVTLDLARRGHEVTALDRDPALLAELAERAQGLNVTTAVADACEFDLGRRFALCVVPMQTIQLLPGAAGRRAFLRRARAHLEGGALLAIAITETFDLFDVVDGMPELLPDMRELDGVLYASYPTATRVDGDGVVLERRRETVGVDGRRTVEHDTVHLDSLSAAELEREAVAAGLARAGRTIIPATAEYVGSSVVKLRA